MTVDLTCLGTRCSLCKKTLADDEGTGFPYKNRILWLDSRCSRKFKRWQLKKRRERAKSRRSR